MKKIEIYNAFMDLKIVQRYNDKFPVHPIPSKNKFTNWTLVYSKQRDLRNAL